MNHYLFVYRRSTGKTLSMKEYSGESWETAWDERFHKELEFKDDADVEVVILSSFNLETLRVTHPRYFPIKSAGNVGALPKAAAY